KGRPCGEKQCKCERCGGAEEAQVHVIPPCALHPRTRLRFLVAGRSPGSRVVAFLGLPEASRGFSGLLEDRSPLTVAGAAAASGANRHRVTFCVPPGGGDRRSGDYTRPQRYRNSKGPTLTNDAPRPLSGHDRRSLA